MTKKQHDEIYWSDNCLLTMRKNILIMKAFLGALSICTYFARIYWLGV